MSQFAFLKSEFVPVYNHARRAETMALADRAAFFLPIRSLACRQPLHCEKSTKMVASPRNH